MHSEKTAQKSLKNHQNFFYIFRKMSEEVKTADVEMAETTPEAKPEVVEVELPIEDVEDLNAVS